METQSGRPLAVVTGASRGIGLELARQCATHGFDVVLTADSAEVQRAADELRTTTDAQVFAFEHDLATFDGVEALYAKIEGLGRPVDALLLNAGVGVGGEFAQDTSLDAELRMIALNCNSVVHLAKRIVGDMIPRRRGRVLITSSIAATMPSPHLSVYGATKAFDLAFAEGLRVEVAKHGITVTTIQPGPTDTNFFRRANIEHTKVAQKKKDDPALVAEQGFTAMMSGRHKVYGGSLKNRMLGIASEFLPEPIKARQHKKLLEPARAEG